MGFLEGLREGRIFGVSIQRNNTLAGISHLLQGITIGFPGRDLHTNRENTLGKKKKKPNHMVLLLMNQVGIVITLSPDLYSGEDSR